jgi:hypothetical protein
MAELIRRLRYNDIDFTEVGDVVYDLEATQSKLSRLLDVRRGTVPFNRGYGLNLEDYLFSTLTRINGNIIFHEILGIVNRELRQLTLVDSQVSINKDLKLYDFKMNFLTPYEYSNLEVSANYDQDRRSFITFKSQ